MMSGRRGSRLVGMAVAVMVGLASFMPGAAFAADGDETSDVTTCASSCTRTGDATGTTTKSDAPADADKSAGVADNAADSTTKPDDTTAATQSTTTVVFDVNGKTTTTTVTYTGVGDVTVPDDTQLDVPEGTTIVGWRSSDGRIYTADLLGAKLNGEPTVTFTAILAGQLPELPDADASQVQVRFVLPGTLDVIVTTTVDRGSSFADAYAAKQADIEAQLPANLHITGWRSALKTYRTDLSDAGTADHDATFFAMTDVQPTTTTVMFSVGALFVTEQAKTGTPLTEVYAAKQGAIGAIVPLGYRITGWTDELTGAKYAADFAGSGNAEGWTMHLVATLEQTGGEPSDNGIHATVTFHWKDGDGVNHTKSVKVLKGLWLLSSDIPSPKAPSGTVLKGWYAADGTRFNRFLPVRADAAYTARWVNIGSGAGAGSTNGSGAGSGSGSGSVAGDVSSGAGAGSSAANRTAAQQWMADSQGKTPVSEQNGTLAKTGTAIAAVAVASALLLLAGTAFSAFRSRRGGEAGEDR